LLHGWCGTAYDALQIADQNLFWSRRASLTWHRFVVLIRSLHQRFNHPSKICNRWVCQDAADRNVYAKARAELGSHLGSS
jgi:hypothetical protein